MSFEHRPSLPALASMIAAVAIGSWGCCTVKCCEPKARIQLVDVEADGGRVSVDPVVISKKRNQQVLWRLPAGSTINAVRVKLERKPAPFDDCQEGEGICLIPCQHRVCSSGPIDPSLVVTESLYYDYHFQRADGSASPDPVIRIDP